MNYDSRQETEKHIMLVRVYLAIIAQELLSRADNHDANKLVEPEKPIFDRVTGQLRGLTYDSQEYRDQLKEMKPALDHHYANNRHHPEHFENGISGMTLVDLVEMFCDWCAATERHDDGDIGRSIDANQDRFEYDNVLASIFANTAREFGIGRNHKNIQR